MLTNRLAHSLLAVTVCAALAACGTTGSFDGAPHADVLHVTSEPSALIASLTAGNAAFASSPDRLVASERDALSRSQEPPVAVLACADSRCAPEWVFEQRPGRLFVVRVAGNVADSLGIASLEYAVAHLKTRVIVVLGHEHCGAVKAAVGGGDPGSESLRALVAAIEPSVAPLRTTLNGDALVHAAIEGNARNTAASLTQRSAILKEAVATGHVKIVAGVHDLDTGVVRFID
ncbi:MAG: carbonic anhydrase [Planctomycetes bacterium]|nr:carbonic anhydrase [Planctomycetota bacterium]